MEEQQQKWAACDEPIQKRPRTSRELPVPGIPTFEGVANVSSQTFLEAYQKYQAVLLKGASNFRVQSSGEHHQKRKDDTLTWKDIGSIFDSLNSDDQDSWCIESRGSRKKEEGTALTPKEFLAPHLQKEGSPTYCSFLLQKDKSAYEKTLEQLPLPVLGKTLGDNNWTYEPCLWVFFGRNYSDQNEGADSTGSEQAPLEGRGLHTDSVSHDGTWHYQMSGTKEWFLSPSAELLNRHWKSKLSEKELSQWDESTKVRVSCEEGDVIVLNTRLWFHRTVLPAQEYPSVSYARDFRLGGGSSDDCGTGAAPSKDSQDHKASSMTNLDGLYARNDIEAGTILFTESAMPDCELHRSNDNPNCEIVELEDGTGAVVSSRAIASGEFFCVPESSDEEEERDEDEEASYEGDDD